MGAFGVHCRVGYGENVQVSGIAVAGMDGAASLQISSAQDFCRLLSLACMQPLLQLPPDCSPAACLQCTAH